MPSTKQVNRNILKRTTPANQSNDWSVLWEPQIGAQPGTIELAEYSGFLHSLSLLAVIKGLEELPLPPNIFEPEINQVERLIAVKSYQSESPRVHLALGLKERNATEWCEVSSIPLLPVSPYQKHDLLEHLSPRIDFLFGRDTQLGFKLVDVGHGLLKDSSYLSFTGAVQEQFYYSGESQNWIDVWSNSSSNLLADSSVLIVESNPRRKYLSVINNGNEVAFLSIGSPATVDTGITLNPKGGSFTLEWQRGSYSQQAIYAISKKATKLAITEGSIQ